jgi:hypothetical protein
VEQQRNDGDTDSLRAAANMRATLSSQLITGSLAILAVEGAFVTFALDKREGIIGFLLLAALAATLIVLSLLFGALGQDSLVGSVAASGGMSPRARNLLRWQTICLGAAIVVFPFAFFFFGHSKVDRLDSMQRRLNKLETEVRSQRTQLNDLEAALQARDQTTRQSANDRGGSKSK